MVMMIINNIITTMFDIENFNVNYRVILSHNKHSKLVPSKFPLQHPIMHEVTF